MIHRFADRSEAGQLLARRLRDELPFADLVIVALPRGGVVIGYEISKALLAPLEALVVRKLGAPDQAELAIGAIASGGFISLNNELIERLELDPDEVSQVKNRAESELFRREARYGSSALNQGFANRNILLVDDGIATGATMEVAIRAVRAQQPKSLKIAVPVAALAAVQRLHRQVDHILALQIESDLGSISDYYGEFPQVTDDEVVEYLEEIRSQRAKERRRHDKSNRSSDTNRAITSTGPISYT